MTDAVVLAGPTGSGKSQLALELAQRLNGELICADRGIAIFIEKPQTLDIAQAVQYRDAIEKSGIVSQVGVRR